MKKTCLFSFLVLCGLLAACGKPGETPPAKSNTVVLKDCHIRTKSDDVLGSPNAIQARDSKEIWTVGEVSSGTVNQALVRKSEDGGATWKSIDESAGPKGGGAANNAIALGKNNDVYVG